MAQTPDTFCSYRSGSSNYPVCTILLRDGSHFPVCKAPVVKETDCPLPLVISENITLYEAGDWLAHIEQQTDTAKSQ